MNVPFIKKKKEESHFDRQLTPNPFQIFLMDVSD